MQTGENSGRRPDPGVATELEPGLRVIIAPNPSPMTERGTNTYLIGTDEIAVIDPGPLHGAHLAAILDAVGEARVGAILVTHAHLDHSPLARPLAERTGAPVLAAGPATHGRSPQMEALARSGLIGGGEGVDAGFAPDRRLADGEWVTGRGWRIEALATPGHMASHLSFAWDGAVFTGDLVMGWASSLISPPDGDMTQFFASMARLQAREDRVFHPGHGAPVADPRARLDALMAHRRSRETQIMEALGDAPADAAGLARRIYTDTPAALLPAAERNVLAHLIDLEGRNRITADAPLHAGAIFAAARPAT